ncbi:NAD(P)H-binding [Actinopolyspora alba]|uniref:NAD(P)H-binding n=1 Tax=Actinopolyspora alba TaxID=673379 RepID=A0A1I1X3U1_9ACTN|nr:NAD(P)H-binding protein [Actinopolyspora alba]SFE01288.1 NAD(P)H-binding [Actinopolyspora alba]
MNVFITGMTGGVGGLLTRKLLSRGVNVGGLVRRDDKRSELSADIALSRGELDWLILRPSLLLDEPGSGTVSLGPAEFHGQIAREDVAETLAELLHEPRIGRRILELDTGSTPIPDAVRANVRER